MYFPEINKLLFELDFMKFIETTNGCFIEDRDGTGAWFDMYNDPDSTFKITIEDWNVLANTDDLFKKAAIMLFKRDYLNKDWESINGTMDELIISNPKEFYEKFKGIKKELNNLKNRIIKKDYLKPISKELLELLDKIITHYSEYEIADKIYFPKINKLLSERDFKRFLSSCNHDYFLERDMAAWQRKYDWDEELGTPAKSAFDIPFEDWYKMSVKNEILLGYIIPYSKGIIAKDWNALNTEMENLKISEPEKYHKEFEAIKMEINTLKENIAKTKHLKPISKELLKELDEVIAFYGGTPENKTTNKTFKEMDNSPKNEPLQWNGGVGSLATLFHDLRTKKSGKGDKVYLDYTPKELQDFILRNFVDEKGDPFPESSVKTYLDPKRPDKKAKNPIDISDLEKK